MLWFSPCWVCKYQVLSTQAGNTLAIAGSCSLSWVSPPKKKTKPHRSSGSRHTRRTDTRAAQRSTSTSTSTPLSLSHFCLGWGLLGPFYPFFLSLACCGCLVGSYSFLFFSSPSYPPIGQTVNLTTYLLTFLLGRSLARSIARFCFASLPYPVFQVVSINILLLLR